MEAEGNGEIQVGGVKDRFRKGSLDGLSMAWLYEGRERDLGQ